VFGILMALAQGSRSCELRVLSHSRWLACGAEACATWALFNRVDQSATKNGRRAERAQHGDGLFLASRHFRTIRIPLVLLSGARNTATSRRYGYLAGAIVSRNSQLNQAHRIG